MCGIAGIASVESHNRDDIINMTNTLLHRGPDEFGYYYDDYISLGHRRLSIIDLSRNAKQPMTDSDNKYTIVFNGEIYNYLQIKDELRRIGYTFISNSDTEIIINAYKQWGKECLNKMNGMFAFAIWDKEKRVLFAARDRAGKKPFYYYYKDGLFLFASEIKALTESGHFEKEIDETGLQNYIHFGYFPDNLSIYKGVSKLEAGYYLIYDFNNIKTDKYWDINKAKVVKTEKEEPIEEFELLLKDSVKTRLLSDVPLGFLLSSGVDSSLITSIACSLGSDVNTFTVGIEGSDLNESKEAEEIAKYLGTKHKTYFVNRLNYVDSVEAISDFIDEPFADSSMVPTYYLTKSVRENITVALTGDGGDEIFAGYPKYNDIRKGIKYKNLPYSLRNLARCTFSRFANDRLSKKIEALAYKNTYELLDWVSSIWKNREISELFTNYDEKDNKFQMYYDKYSTGSDAISDMMRIDYKLYLCDDILVKADRMSMANSLELRSPLLDYRIAEFVSSLPDSLIHKNNESKFLQKSVLKKYMPLELLAKKKKGFEVPMNDWLRKELYEYFNDTVNRESVNDFGYLSWEYLNVKITEHMSGKRNYGQKLFCILMLILWYKKQYKIG